MKHIIKKKKKGEAKTYVIKKWGESLALQWGKQYSVMLVFTNTYSMIPQAFWASLPTTPNCTEKQMATSATWTQVTARANLPSLAHTKKAPKKDQSFPMKQSWAIFLGVWWAWCRDYLANQVLLSGYSCWACPTQVANSWRILPEAK